jgi:DNA sulfur modification protein DndE
MSRRGRVYLKGVVAGLVVAGAIASVSAASPQLGGEAATFDEPAQVLEPSIPSPPALRDGVETYVYGYPLLMMALTERVATTIATTSLGATRAPINQFVYGIKLPDSRYSDVVLPSTSTLYASTFLDLSIEPMVVHIPPIDRFFLLETLDAWTNVSTSSPGTRQDSQPGDYAFVGPDWKPVPLPNGISIIRMPTNTVWIIGRIFTTGTDADLEHIKTDIVPSLTVKPLSAVLNGGAYTPPSPVPVDPSIDTLTTPLHQVANMDACAFYGTLAAMMKTNRPLSQDAGMVQRLANIGIEPGNAFDCYVVPQDRKVALQAAVVVARTFLQTANPPTRKVATHWQLPLNVGSYDQRYLLRAFVAERALGANLPADAVYGYTQEDGRGANLSGTERYQIHFDPPTDRRVRGQLPPVSDKAFWSLTIYNNDGTLVAPPTNPPPAGWPTYNAIGVGPKSFGKDRATIQAHEACFNADGSLDIWLRSDPPTDPSQLCNWIPIPPTKKDPAMTGGDFIAFLRLYMPDDSVLNRRWIPPRIDLLTP